MFCSGRCRDGRDVDAIADDLDGPGTRGRALHVNVLDVNYSANVDLLNTSVWQTKKTLLAPRFLWLNQGVRDLMEDALIAIAGAGKPIDATLEDYSKQIKQKLQG